MALLPLRESVLLNQLHDNPVRPAEVAPFPLVLSRFHKDIQLDTKHVLFWGGLRGAISLALALSLTVEELGPGLEILQAMAFGVVLFTLLVQGATMALLLRRLNLTGKSV